MKRPEENIGLWYHQLSKDESMGGKLNIISDDKQWPEAWKETEYKEYLNRKQISLDVVEAPKNSESLEKLILDRESERDFASRKHALTKKELSYLCQFGLGESKKNSILKRNYPSGGARYSLEVYIYINSSTELEKGLYHYNVPKNTLEFMGKINIENLKGVFTYEWAYGASAYIFITTVFNRNMRKYHERGYRMILQESGHLGQNLYLLATNLSLNIVAISGTDDAKVEKLLGIDGINESLVYTILIG